MPTFSLRIALLFLLVSAATATVSAQATRAASGPAKVLVRVDGAAITSADLERMYLSRMVPEKLRVKARQTFLDQMVDAKLIERYLAQKKVVANQQQLDEQVAVLLKLVSEDGKIDPATKLAEMGYTEKSLRDELALPLAWQTHLMKTTTEEQIADYFEKHRQELDGTQIQVSHILIKAPAAEPAERKAAAEQLRKVRGEIVAKKLTFAEAAKKYSQSPTSEKGGDVGYITWEGKMPAAFSKVAFALKPGEISEPFESPFGVHLCTVFDRKPGQLSLEDARPDLLRRLSEEQWQTTVATLRKTAKIEWAAP